MKSRKSLWTAAISLVMGMPAFAESVSWSFAWGYSQAIAVPADYDGDGATDFGVYDPSTGAWYVYSPHRQVILAWNVQWGFGGATPHASDFDGDGTADLAVYDTASANWYVYSLAQDTVLAWGETWGGSGLVPVPGDYNGDGRTEKAVYDRSDGSWHILEKSPYSGEDIEMLWPLYTNAVAHAMKPRSPQDICRGLTALVTNNPTLDWRRHPDSGIWQVKMVSLMTPWTASNYYQAGKSTLLPTNAVAWLTAYPELKNFCRCYRGTNLLMRVKQLLGLHPLAANDTVVEYWVDPSFLIRPSPDPEITDCEAQPDFSFAQNRFITLSDDYIKLFERLHTTQYDPEWPYPWSRAGYTYDWAEGTNRPFGLSEFVIHADWLYRGEGIRVSVDVITVQDLFTYVTENISAPCQSNAGYLPSARTPGFGAFPFHEDEMGRLQNAAGMTSAIGSWAP